MNKDSQFKLSVDDYSENDNETFTCACYVPGDNVSAEHIEKVVTKAELMAYVCDGSNRVSCAYNGDDTEALTFDQWYDNNRMSLDMLETLGDLINKKEGRKLLMDMPDVSGSLGAILNPFALTLKTAS